MKVADLFKRDFFQDFKLAAGSEGLNKEITAVSVLDTPDGYRWMRGGELLLSSGFVFQQEPKAFLNFLSDVSSKEIAALGIKLDRFLPQLPQEAIDKADEFGLPLIEIPVSYRWSDVIDVVCRQLIQEGQRRHTEQDENMSEVLLAGKLADTYKLLLSLAAEVQRKIFARSPQLGLYHIFHPNGSIEEVNEKTEDAVALLQGEKGDAQVSQRGPLSVGLRLIKNSPPRWMATYSIPHETPMELGVILAPSERSPSKHQDKLMIRAISLLRVLALEAVYASNKDVARRERFLENLCLGFYNNSAIINERAQQLGLKLSFPSSVILGVPTSGDDIHRWTPPFKLAYRMGNSWVIIADVREYKKEELQALAEAKGLWFLIGTQASGPLEIYRSYQEVKGALDWVRNFDAPAGVYHFYELALYALLSNLGRLPEAESLWERYWKPLLESKPGRHAISALQLACSLIQCDFNAKRAAEVLHLHYNTIRNYLNDLENLLHIDLKNSHHRLALTLSYFVNRSRENHYNNFRG